MTDSRAIELLAACRPVAVRIASTNSTRTPPLNAADLAALRGLAQVRETGYPYQKLKVLAQRAGLAPADLGVLNWVWQEQNIANRNY